MTRVYLPLVVSMLASVEDRGTVPVPTSVHAVTADLRARDPQVDEEDLEFEAMCAALDAAAGLRTRAGERRVVVAADVPTVSDDGDLAVRLPGEVPLEDVVSFHCEEAAGTPQGEGYDDLLWYDVTELADLVGSTTA